MQNKQNRQTDEKDSITKEAPLLTLISSQHQEQYEEDAYRVRVGGE